MVLLVGDYGLVGDRLQEVSLQGDDCLGLGVEDAAHAVDQALYWLVVVDLVGDYCADRHRPAHVRLAQPHLRAGQVLQQQAQRQVDQERRWRLIDCLYQRYRQWRSRDIRWQLFQGVVRAEQRL